MVLKNVFITKISKTFDFFGQRSKKNSCFSRCFHMESPYHKMSGGSIFTTGGYINTTGGSTNISSGSTNKEGGSISQNFCSKNPNGVSTNMTDSSTNPNRDGSTNTMLALPTHGYFCIILPSAMCVPLYTVHCSLYTVHTVNTVQDACLCNPSKLQWS